MARGKKKETLTPEERLQATLVPESEQPYPVPGNWCWVKVGTISKVKGGKRLPKGRTFLEEKSDYPYIRVTDFDNESISIENVKYIDCDTHMMIKNYTISSADIYISIAGTIGKVGIIPEELEGANLTENAAKITDINGAYQLYLMLFLKSEVAQNQMKDSTISTTQPKLALFRIEDILLPLPPLSEQQRVVDRIENLFAKLDEARQKAQDALDSFETRKAAILHKAFTGELTAQWRIEHGVGMESWDTKPLLRVTKNHDSERIPLSQAERSNLARVYDYYGASGVIDKVDRFLFEGRKLLIGEDGANLVTRSKPIAFIAEGQYWVNNHAHVLSVTSEMLLDFLCHYINSIDLTPYVTGSAQPKMTQAKMNTIPVPVPTVDEQAEIVRILDDLLDKEQQAKEAAEGVLGQIDLIKKAILARAFRGELGTNDPSEESAVELVKRVIERGE